MICIDSKKFEAIATVMEKYIDKPGSKPTAEEVRENKKVYEQVFSKANPKEWTEQDNMLFELFRGYCETEKRGVMR